jgi:hypothetical protein
MIPSWPAVATAITPSVRAEPVMVIWFGSAIGRTRPSL